MQLRALSGKRQKLILAIAQIRGNDRTDAGKDRLNGWFRYLRQNRCFEKRRVGAKWGLPEGQVAKLPAHMQQALPDVNASANAFIDGFRRHLSGRHEIICASSVGAQIFASLRRVGWRPQRRSQTQFYSDSWTPGRQDEGNAGATRY